MTDDSWKDSYDSWKLESPDDDYDNEPWYNAVDDDWCEHEEYDIDIVTGDWMCWRCGEHRAATTAEIEMMIQHQAEYAEYEDRENRRQWWRDRFGPILRWWEAVRSIFLRPKPAVIIAEDEIPF